MSLNVAILALDLEAMWQCVVAAGHSCKRRGSRSDSSVSYSTYTRCCATWDSALSNGFCAIS
jgi:hypothetical protein